MLRRWSRFRLCKHTLMIVMVCDGLKLEICDGLPHKVCKRCIRDLRTCHSLMEQFRHADQYLRAIAKYSLFIESEDDVKPIWVRTFIFYRFIFFCEIYSRFCLLSMFTTVLIKNYIFYDQYSLLTYYYCDLSNNYVFLVIR